MAARSGMTTLLSQFRNLVSDAGTVAFTDDRAQEILDARRMSFYQQPLVVTAQQIASGTVVYHTYTLPYGNLEGTASGTAAFRLFDSVGSVITSGYTLDAQNGVITFTTNQAGSARYLDGRSYDLYGAVADGWREKAGQQASGYDFRVEGRAYSRSQWYKHCFDLARLYDSMARPTQAVIERSDTC
jgi:hypothetical protein